VHEKRSYETRRNEFIQNPYRIDLHGIDCFDNCGRNNLVKGKLAMILILILLFILSRLKVLNKPNPVEGV
jgi:hypothetical protein